MDCFNVDRIGDVRFQRAGFLLRNVNCASVTKGRTEDIRATQGSLAVTSW